MRRCTRTAWMLIALLGPPRAALGAQCLLGEIAGTDLSQLAATGDLDGDGIDDFVTRAPSSLHGANTGAVVAWSGATLQPVWRVDGLQASERFGDALARVGDLDGDGVDELLVGAPGVGMARVLSGVDGTILMTFVGPAGSARSVAAPGDVDLDGIPDLAIGITNPAGVQVFGGASGALLHSWTQPGTTLQALRPAGDLNGDGRGDLLALFTNNLQIGTLAALSGADGGVLFTIQAPAHTPSWGWNFDGNHPLVGARDLDGDGVPDIVVGDPFYPHFFVSHGRVQAYSGATGAELWSYEGEGVAADIGASLSILDDVDGDGTPDVLAGSLAISMPYGPHVISGAYGTRITHIRDEQAATHLGWRNVALGDLDGDGRGELLLGHQHSLRIYSFACAPIALYCQAKVNSLGCTPQLVHSGAPSSLIPFWIWATNLRSQQAGILIYSLAGPASLPFQGGVLCLQAPITRTPVRSTGGGFGCDGALGFEFNAWVAGGSPSPLAPGSQVWAQFWSRDPDDPFGTNTTGAIHFQLQP